MIDRKLFQKTFSTLHASPDTLSEVYRAVREEEHPKSPRRRHTISKSVLIAAVLAMCITVAGAAGVSIAGLIKANVTPSASITTADLHAFSADSMDSETPIVLDNYGDVLCLPRMERVSTDAKTMWRLVGDYLSTVDAAMEVDGYTIQLNTFLIDENGTGFLTYTLSNPNGVTYDDNGYGEVYTPLAPWLYIGDPSSHRLMDAKTYLDAAASTDTALHLVLYFSDFGYWHKGDDLIFAVDSHTNGVETTWGGAIGITPRSYLPVTTFTARNGDTVRVSALGIQVNATQRIAAAELPLHELRVLELTLHMKDGSQYVVESERSNVMNWVVGLGTVDDEHNANGCGYSFNRLVDVDNVESITAQGYGLLASDSLIIEEETPSGDTAETVDTVEDVYREEFDNTYTR